MKPTTQRSADKARLSFYVESLLAAAQKKADADQQAEGGHCKFQVYSPDDLERFQLFWAMSRDDGSANAKAVLKALDKHSALWPCSPVPADTAFVELAERFPNFTGVIEDVRRAAALARLAPGAPLHMAPVLLDGPPGIGKSKFASELALTFAVPMLTFSMAQATASFGLGGLNAQYLGGGPGYLVRSLADLGVPDLLVVVDEIDKAAVHASHDPTMPLYELLEINTAARFVDEGLRMPLNLSAIKWVSTCNDAMQIAAPLRSRFLHYEVPPPTPEQLRSIASSVYHDIVRIGSWARHFDPDLPEPVLDALADGIPRDLARAIRTALGAAALAGRSTVRIGDLPVNRRSSRPRIGFA